MKNLATVLVSTIIMLAGQQILHAQNRALGSDFAGDAPLARTATISDRIALLERRRVTLEQALSSPPVNEDVQRRALLLDWIRDLNSEIDQLTQARSGPTKPPPDASTATTYGAVYRSVAAPVQVQTEPQFDLSRPGEGNTNEITQLQLAWTEDKQPNKTYSLQKFIVEVAIDDKRLPNGRFARAVYVKEEPPRGVTGQQITVPKDILRTGQKYRWQVFAVYVATNSQEMRLKLANNSPRSFRTESQTFSKFEEKGFTLQRAVTGDDAGEGAQFGFVKTFNKDTVYTAEFALIYDHWFTPTQRTATAFEASVQASLTSDETESEDAVQFRAGAIIDRNLKRGTINHLYVSLAGKYETDQKFKVGKLISENMLTPTIPSLHIGIPFGRPSNAVQFRWRPYFYFDVGRTFKKGDSTETKDTVLRFTPRVRTILTLNFLRRALNMNDTFLFADDFFYFTPLETKKNRHNLFTSGFAAQVTKDFGFGLAYKKGEAAPKFKPVHTFAGVLTIRFGKKE